jgi:hypothetical protein
MANDKVKPRNLRPGDVILVTRVGIDLAHATTKRDSMIARIVAPPDVAESPVPGARRGYALDTHLGRIPFVTGVSSIMVPNAADIRRDQQEQRERDRRAAAESESAGVLGGLSLSDEQRAAVKVAPAARTAPTQRREQVTVPSPAQVAVAASRSVPPGRGANAAANYRAMARGALTDAARDFWENKAREALA